MAKVSSFQEGREGGYLAKGSPHHHYGWAGLVLLLPWQGLESMHVAMRLES